MDENLPRIYIPSKTAALFHKAKSPIVGRPFVKGLIGPIGSSKSSSTDIELMKQCLRTPICRDGIRRAHSALIRKTYAELEETTMETWRHWFPDEDYGHIRMKAPFTQHMRLLDDDGVINEFKFTFLAMNREDSISKLRSYELTHILFNELDQQHQSTFEEGISRLMRYPSKSMLPDDAELKSVALFDANMIHEMSWLKDVLFVVADDGSLLSRKDDDVCLFIQPPALLKDGAGGFIPNPEAENISNLNGGYEYYYSKLATMRYERFKVLVLNEMGSLHDGEAVYRHDYNPDVHRSNKELSPVPGYTLDLCFDFGRNPCCIIVQFINGRCIVLDEVVIKEALSLETFTGSFLSPVLQSDKYKAFRVGAIRGTADPAGNQKGQLYDATCINHLNELGLNVTPCYTQDPEVRIDSIRHYLIRMVAGKPAMEISKTCKMIHKGMESGYHFKSFTSASTGQKIISEKPDKNEYSHPIEALQYGCAQNIIRDKQDKNSTDGIYYVRGRPMRA